MANPAKPRKLLVLQHNCTRGGQVLKSALETAVKMEADLVLIQEPRERGGRDGTRAHLNFNFIQGVENEPA